MAATAKLGLSRTASSTTTTPARRRSARKQRPDATTDRPAMPLSVSTAASVPMADPERRLLTPPPVSARTDLTRRFGEVSMTSVAEHNANANANAANAHSLLSSNRAVLLSGLTKPDATKPAATKRDPDTPLAQNRQLTPLVTVAPSPRIISPVVYVKAVAVRRASAASEVDKAGAHADANARANARANADTGTTTGTTVKTESRLSTPPPETRLVVSARVTPARTGKDAFTLHREFDLAELVGRLPRPDHRRPSCVNILASPVVRSPLPPAVQAPSPSAGQKRRASGSTPASPHPTLRRASRQASDTDSDKTDSEKMLPSMANFAAAGGLPIPLVAHASLSRMPALAAVILSARVEPGDLLEIQMPFPDAWQRTVSYVYKNLDNAEADVKANLEHLGGHVTAPVDA